MLLTLIAALFSPQEDEGPASIVVQFGEIRNVTPSVIIVNRSDV